MEQLDNTLLITLVPVFGSIIVAIITGIVTYKTAKKNNKSKLEEMRLNNSIKEKELEQNYKLKLQEIKNNFSVNIENSYNEKI